MKSRVTQIASIAIAAVLVLVVAEIVIITGSAAHASQLAVPGAFAYSTHSGDIWIVNGDGSHRRQLTHSGAGFDFGPTWSPDGKHLAFQSTRGRHAPSVETSIFVVGADGTGQRQLLTPATFRFGGTSPAWSPNGVEISFGSANGLALANPTGGDVKFIGIRGDQPAWSPDSTKLAYRGQSIAGDASRMQIFVLRLGSKRPHRLTGPAADDFTGPWSPDGKRLAFFARTGASGHVWVIDANGANAHQITRGAGTQFASAWLPDGRLLVGISRPRETTPRWYLIRANGSKPQPIPQLKDAISVAWRK